MEIRKLCWNEIHLALALVWDVFLEYEAPDYPQEGIDEFRSFLDNREEIDKLSFTGAWENGNLLGVLAMRGNHISLLFVKKEYHRRGIAKALFANLQNQTEADQITVNSSPYAREIYGKLGFQAIAAEQVTNGIRYIPMVYVKKGLQKA